MLGEEGREKKAQVLNNRNDLTDRDVGTPGVRFFWGTLVDLGRSLDLQNERLAGIWKT